MGTLNFDPSDPQQFQVYDAEADMEHHRAVHHYRDKGGALAFIARVTTSPEWRALGGPEYDDIKIVWTKHDSGVATCYRGENKICLPGWAYNQRVILHELTHLVTLDGHGPMFTGTALMLYRRFISHTFAEDMEAKYRRHCVRYKRRRFKHTKRQTAQEAQAS